MKTEAIYLLKPYEKSVKARIIEYLPDGENKFNVILDQTVFYPMGGGQPTDQGTLSFSNGNIAKVYQVQVKNGEIWHSIEGIDSCNVGDEVEAVIDWDRRYKNMKVHSGGHIVDSALVKLGYVPKRLEPQKGDHGKKPFISYKVIDENLKSFNTEELAKLIEREANFLIEQDLKISWDFTTLDELKVNAVYLQPNLPENKPLRRLNIDTVGSFADGGTIVERASEIGRVKIEKVIIDGEILEVHYSIVESEEKSEKKKAIVEVTAEMINDMREFLPYEKALTDAENYIRDAINEEELTKIWRGFLGKEGNITKLFKEIKNIPNEKKKNYGILLNDLQDKVSRMVERAKESLKNATAVDYYDKPVAELEVKFPKVGHLHPLTQTTNDLNAIFRSLGFSIMDGPEIETDEYCFQRLNLPLDHPARDLQDSIYIEEPNILLRTQTSSIEARVIQDFKPPYKVVMPGRVYRNEKVNKSNHFTFHQYQLTVVKEKVSMAELFAIINYMFKTFLGEDTEVRFRCKYYPEVEPGVGPDMKCFNCHGDGCPVCKGRGWLEMGGAGIIHPNVLKMGGLDPSKWQGYAFGMGLDRWAMAKHKITDIRTLLGGNLAYKPN